MTNTQTHPAYKIAIPWSIVIGIAPFFYLSAQSYFTAINNKEQIELIRDKQDDILSQISRLEVRQSVNLTLLREIDKKIEKLAK